MERLHARMAKQAIWVPLNEIPNSNNSTIEAKGQWNWGHQKDIVNAVSANSRVLGRRET